MPKTKLEALWWFGLTPDDARLMLAALGGRLREDQYEAAKELGDELTRMRAKDAARFADQMETHARNADRTAA